MHLPGFTAEFSLSPSHTNYNSHIAYTGGPVEGIVLPQFFFCHGRVCCDEWGNCIYRGPVLQ
jgi:hypothetical protein